MIYSHEVEMMCPVAQGAAHGAAPIPEEAKWVKAKEIKDISALLWVNENSVPTIMAYGKYDKVQPYEGSQRLLRALEENHVPHDYYLCTHSGHGLQNDNKVYGEYMRKILEYLDTYMPVK